MSLRTALGSSVGTKIVIALTGLALVGFLIFHLAGNLLVFAGADAFNDHADTLIRNPLIIPAEIGLLALFLLHAGKAVLNVAANRRARPVGYAQKVWAGGPSRKSAGSTTMIVTGVVTFVFVALHLRTFKYGPYYTAPLSNERDLYRLLIEVFTNPWYVGFYVVSLVLLGLHLQHGIASAVQSIGAMPSRLTRGMLRLGLVLAALIAGGFVAVPVWVYFFL